MYLEKKVAKGKTKYYLAHSFREGDKVHKIRKLLGADLTKEVLEDRRIKAEKLILDEIEKYNLVQDPLEHELSNDELEFIRKLEKEADFRVFHLSEKEWEIFSKVFTFNTNAIEGSELTQKEVSEVVGENKWPDKSKGDIAEAYGVNEAIKFIRETNEHFSLELLKEIHKLVFKNSKVFAGEFRKKGQEVVVTSSSGKVIHEGAPQSRVIGLLNSLSNWYNKYRGKYPALVLAAVVHNQFENIHPFADGNGRVGRIILNNILIKHGLPPINIRLSNRPEYYQVLQEYENKKNIRPTIEFLLKEYKNTKKEIL